MEWLHLVLSLLAGLSAILYFSSRKLNKLEKLGVLHEKPLPIVGNMAPIIFRMSPFAEIVDKVYKLNDEAKYVGFYDFGEPMMILRSLDLIKDVTIKHFDHFVDHRGFVDATREPLMGNNLFLLRGDKWKTMRNLLTPAFTSSKMRAMFRLMSDCASNFADFVADRATNKPYVIESKDAFTRYTNDVIATCAFGLNVDSMRNPNNEFYLLGRKAVDFEGVASLKFFALRSFPRVSKFFNVKLIGDKVATVFENIVRETIETRTREGIVRPDMLQLMMESRDDESRAGPKPSMREMTSQAFVFFLGGFDTTASLMCFVAHEIAVNPAIQKTLRDEIEKISKETNGDVTYDAINQMRYLDAVVNEALRLYPVINFLDRQCVKTYELPPAFPGAKPVVLQPGDNVWIPVYSLQRDPKYFPNPDAFDPERFMKTGQDQVDPLAHISFGLGPRMCIGNRFALLETKVLLFHLLSKCRLKPALKTRVPLELSASSFVFTAKGGFWLEIEAIETTL